MQKYGFEEEKWGQSGLEMAGTQGVTCLAPGVLGVLGSSTLPL